MSSPITLSGFNNIDFKAITDIIIQSERQPINSLTTQKSNFQNRLTSYGVFTSNLLNLKSAFDALSSSTSYSNLAASSSDSTVLTASASSEASRGTFSIEVTSLARPQVTVSDTSTGRVADINANIITGGAFSITPHGATQEVSIDMTGVQTLAQFRDAINQKQTDTGVTASIINDGADPDKPFRLVLTSDSAGIAHDFVWDGTTLTFQPGFNLNLATDPVAGVAANSVFTYNGISISNSSTSVSDAIPGLTLSLMKKGTASVTVASDDSSLKSKIKAMVSAFNSFTDFTTQVTTSGTKSLQGDPLLRGANRELRNFITSSHSNSGATKYLSELGITLDRTGKMQIDDATLNDALANHRSDVTTFLSGSSGFAARISSTISAYTRAGGSIDSAEKGIQTAISSYDQRIDVLESQLRNREQDLIRQFTAADQAISQLNSQANSLASLSGQYRLF